MYVGFRTAERFGGTPALGGLAGAGLGAAAGSLGGTPVVGALIGGAAGAGIASKFSRYNPSY